MSAQNIAANSFLTLNAKGAHLRWVDSPPPDLATYEVWISQRPGGPYSRVNTPAILTHEWTTPELRFGTFYLVITALDQLGNRSVNSNEVRITIE